MPWYAYIWTTRAIDKCSQHGVSQDDFEFVMLNSENETTGHVVNDVQRFATQGETEDGRWIKCVYEKFDDTTIIPITAFENRDL
ncbi:hypothetical protein [Planctomicrobium piriforme]|uniref:DUF4258 domain-containing protein n=1 Tax=Planctomicrobium piriforme TaxID=1576369 RepID=A0A1I3QJH1_9PLAN|nr:hypothetical protein [Planctomicrobium piriforme]SFJ33397.1 hypothetical protein SAMN05421753_11893 [Planctomicrobium piriforme]